MIIVKLAAAIFIFALPIGVLCGFAARQVKLGSVSRFPNHEFPLRIVILQITAVVGVAVIWSFHRGTFSLIVVGLVAGLIIQTGIIAYVTYNLLMRRKAVAPATAQPAVANRISKAEEAGFNFAEWVHDHPNTTKAAFWMVVAIAQGLLVLTTLDVANRGSWFRAALLFFVVG